MLERDMCVDCCDRVVTLSMRDTIKKLCAHGFVVPLLTMNSKRRFSRHC